MNAMCLWMRPVCSKGGGVSLFAWALGVSLDKGDENALRIRLTYWRIGR